MIKTVIPLITLCLLLTFYVCPQNSWANSRAKAALTNPFQEADKLFTLGDDLQRDKQSLAVVEKALASDASNYQWLWRAARCYYFVGDNASKAEKVALFEKGINAGQRALAQHPSAVEGHFWLAANYGGYSQEKGMFSALATIKKIRAEMETVLKLNDRYHDGGAYLALGEMDRQLPRIIGGNLSRAISWLERGVQVAPNNLEMKLVLAQAYQEAGRKDEARRHAQEITERTVQNRGERQVQEKARRMLGRS